MLAIPQPPFARLQSPQSFYFVRHGESKANSEGIMQGNIDGELSEQGKIQAKITGDWLRENAEIDTIISSPLQRARETAEIIAEQCGLSVAATDPRIIEIDIGIFSGLTAESAAEQRPDIWALFQSQSWEIVPKAERIARLVERASDYWKWLIDYSNEKNRAVLSVSHGGIMQWIIKVCNGSAPLWSPIIQIENCSVAKLFVRPAPMIESKPQGHFSNWHYINRVAYS